MDKRISALLERDSTNKESAPQNNIVLFDGIDVPQSLVESYGRVTNMKGQFLKDIELFNRLDTIIKQDDSIKQDIKYLEKYRMFREGTLDDKGIFYVENKYDLLRRYPFLQASSIPMYSNNVLDKRYLYPIRLMSGQIITYMGYYIPEEEESANTFEPYEVPNVGWVLQSRLLGNLDSLARYPNNPLKLLFVVEGFTDAWRIEETFHKPAICLFGSSLYKLKRALLARLKSMGYYLIYVYDRDVAGEKPMLLKNPIWNNLMTFPEEKDIDFYVSWYYKFKVSPEDKEDKTSIPINNNHILPLLKTFQLHKPFCPTYGTDLAAYIMKYW